VQETMSSEKLLTITEVADLLNLSCGFVAKLVEGGRLPDSVELTESLDSEILLAEHHDFFI